jgi:prepilin-type N-terminal cleavage/methylation domain-containing protein
MKTKLQKNSKGFTIIEVLIVLAIAGLIMLIVFLAVPALQRNSRNTQRKNDVAGVLGAVAERVGNNNGNLPTATSEYTGQVNLGFYTTADISQAAGAQSPVTDTNTVVRIVTGARCGAGGATVAGSSRQYVAQYAVETGGGGNTPICQEG